MIGWRHQEPTLNAKMTFFTEVHVHFVNAIRIYYVLSVFDKKNRKCCSKTVITYISEFIFPCKMIANLLFSSKNTSVPSKKLTKKWPNAVNELNTLYLRSFASTNETCSNLNNVGFKGGLSITICLYSTMRWAPQSTYNVLCHVYTAYVNWRFPWWRFLFREAKFRTFWMCSQWFL